MTRITRMGRKDVENKKTPDLHPCSPRDPRLNFFVRPQSWRNGPPTLPFADAAAPWPYPIGRRHTTRVIPRLAKRAEGPHARREAYARIVSRSTKESGSDIAASPLGDFRALG